MIEYHTAIQPHLAPMFHLHHHSADLQLNTLKRSTELGEASHRSISSGRAGKRMQRSIPRGMRIQKKESLRLIAESEASQENGSYLLSHCYAVPSA